jgi:nucleoside-diphosphate-sugar epimerase
MLPAAAPRLVIFGCGYVGGALARAARERGIAVTALTRNHAKAAELEAAGIATVVGELSDAAWHDRLPAGADWVANTVSAAEPTVEGYRRSYVAGMESVFAWAGKGGRPIGTLVYTSSTGVYPQGGGAVVDESAPTVGAGPTGRVLVEAEDLLRAAPASIVARSFIFRLAGIYGPGRHHLLDSLRAGAATLPGEAGFRLNLAHRDDIVSALLAAFDAPPAVGSAVLNVSDDAPATRGEVAAWLAARLGRPVPAFAGAAASARKGGIPAPDRIIRSRRIRATLGWSPRHADFRSGYAEILGQL